MKKFNIYQWTDHLTVCSEKPCRIMKFIFVLSMILLLNVAGGMTIFAKGGNDPSEAILQVRVTGTIVDENGNPLTGVAIQVEGTTIGAMSDINGKFSVSCPNQNSVLIFSFVGYQVQKIPVSGKSVIDVRMTPDVKALEEVVVIGYGVQRRSDLTGSVGSVKAEALAERPATTAVQSIAGKITGVNITVNSGRPGGRQFVRIRGNSSLSITNEPLYIVDGVQMGNIDYINPGDISSIEILKDASATAIYGARGSNGVILVTTKKGTVGGKVSYDVDVSIGKMRKYLDLCNAQEWSDLEWICYNNAQKYDPVGWAAGKYVSPALRRVDPRLWKDGKPIYDTDWQKESTQDAFTHNHNLSFTGGDNKTQYGIFLGYRDEQGLIKTSYLKRYSGRFTLDSQINKWLKVGGSINYVEQRDNKVDETSAGVEVLRAVNEQLPVIPPKYPDGTWGSNEHYPGVEASANPVKLLNTCTVDYVTHQLLGNVYADITLAPGLNFRSTFGVRPTSQRREDYYAIDVEFTSRSQQGIANVYNYWNNYWQSENYLTYNKKIGTDHNITGLLGASWWEADGYNVGTTVWGFTDDFFKTNNLSVATTPRPSSSGKSASSMNSYFARVNYGYKEKYLLTLSARADGSSKFGPENRFAFFPSAALAWKAGEEEFIKNIPAISNLKLRASYGFTGNSEISSYQALAGLGNYQYILNNAVVTGIGLGRLPNGELRWEKTGQADIGLELGLLNDRINLEADVYRKMTTDMLMSCPIPASSGFTAVTKNIGSMKNTGIELALNTVNISTSNFSWQTSFNWSFNKLEMVKLGLNDADIFIYRNDIIARVGKPISFFTYHRLGTWSTSEAEEAALYNKKPGDVKLQDVNNDKQITVADRVFCGKGTPDAYGSFINTFNFKNLELLVDIQYMYGNRILQWGRLTQGGRTGIANCYTWAYYDAWTEDKQNTMVAQLRPTTAGYSTYYDDYFIDDAGFIRGRNIALSYNFPADMIRKLSFSSLRLTASVQNVFVITKYQGYDPEVASNTTTYGQGVSGYSGDYPKPRVFMLSLNVSF